MINNIFKGVLTALITPFYKDQIDLLSLERIIDHQIKGGVDGIIIGGSTGEGMNLATAEYELLLKNAVKFAKGKLAVIGACASTSSSFALEIAKLNGRLGSNGIMITVPPYVRPSQEGIYEHFKLIHNEVDLPIMVYSILSRTGTDVSDSTLLKLAELPNILGMKDSCANLSRAIRISSQIKPEFNILAGDDELALAFNAQGAKGCVSVASNIVPKKCKQVQDSWKQKNISEALRLQHELLPLYQSLYLEPNPTGIKFASHLLGLCKNELRLPLLPCTPDTQSKIKHVMGLLHG